MSYVYGRLIINMVSERGGPIPDRYVARKKGLIAFYVIRQRKTNAASKVFFVTACDHKNATARMVLKQETSKKS